MRWLILILILISLPVQAKHLHPEAYYQEIWCNQNNGQLEYILDDFTRVDCLTKDYAVEFDFAKKWAESIGQSLHYSYKTGKQAGIVLILEQEKDKVYYDRIIPLCNKYNITLWYMKPDNN